MNSKLILLLLCLQSAITINAQNLSKDVREDFCKNAIIEYYYGTGSLKTWLIQSARTIGILTPKEIEESIQNISKNEKLQEEFFKNFSRLGGSKEFKVLQFTNIRMEVEHAKLLVDYIYLKYNNTNTSDFKKEIENDFIEVTNKINNHNLLKSIFPQGIFVNDSLILQKQNFLNSNNTNEEVEFRTEVAKQILYTSNKDEERLLVVLSSYKNKENDLTPTYINTLIFSIEGNNFKMVKQGRINLDSEYKTEINYNLIFENNNHHFVIEYVNEEKNIVKKYYNLTTFSHEKNLISPIEKQ